MGTGELLHPPPSVLPRDIGKFEIEAHRRLSSPLTAASFAMIALLSVLAGPFRRHGNLLRPFTAVMSVVGLLALGLTIGNLAARRTALIPLIYIEAVLPGLFCAWRLFGSDRLRRHIRRLRFRSA
jgi:lipopolysaccharide export system permease protein